MKTDLCQYWTQTQRGLTMSSKATCQGETREKTQVSFIKETKEGKSQRMRPSTSRERSQDSWGLIPEATKGQD